MGHVFLVSPCFHHLCIATSTLNIHPELLVSLSVQRVCFLHQNSSVYSVSYPFCWDQEDLRKKNDESKNVHPLLHWLYLTNKFDLTAEAKFSLGNDFCLVNG